MAVRSGLLAELLYSATLEKGESARALARFIQGPTGSLKVGRTTGCARTSL